ncbi:aminotransferase, partial [Nocardia sp. BSTN01]|nr:aminotransferase [Nocardia sp. BSTN01]
MTSSAYVPALAGHEFAVDTTYLDTASYGIPPARAFTAVRAVL